MIYTLCYGYFRIFIGFTILMTSNYKFQNQSFSVKNSTPTTLFDIDIFGIHIDSIPPNTVSSWYDFSYNPNTDDTMIYCNTKGYRYASYVHIPDTEIKKFCYELESIKNQVLLVKFMAVYE
jgi:hypothetical protein